MCAVVVSQVCDDLQDVYSEEAQELLCLLLRPHFKVLKFLPVAASICSRDGTRPKRIPLTVSLWLQAMLQAHDAIALKDFMPELHEVPHEVDEDDESAIKLVRLLKGASEPLVEKQHQKYSYGSR
jgi:hypothetical protein